MLRENNYKIIQPKMSYPTKIAFKSLSKWAFSDTPPLWEFTAASKRMIKKKTLASQKINSQEDKIKEKIIFTNLVNIITGRKKKLKK